MKDINFLQSSGVLHAASRDNSKQSAIIAVIIVFLLFLAIGAKMLLVGLNYRIAADIETMQAFITDNAIIYELEGNINNYNAQLNKTEDLISRLDKTNVKNSEVFEILGKAIPNKIYMSTYSFTDKRELVVTGYSPEKEEVARYTWALKQLKAFRNVYLNSVTKVNEDSGVGSKYEYQFTVEL